MSYAAPKVVGKGVWIKDKAAAPRNEGRPLL